MGLGNSAGGADLCFGLRLAVLGRTAPAVGYRCGDDGNHSGVHDAFRDPDYEDTAADAPAGGSAIGGNCRSCGSGEPQRQFWRRSHRCDWGWRPDRGGDQLVGGIGAHAKATLPRSKAMSSGAQMLAGGVLLTVTAGMLGELRGFHAGAVSLRAWLSLAYLIVAG